LRTEIICSRSGSSTAVFNVLPLLLFSGSDENLATLGISLYNKMKKYKILGNNGQGSK